MWFYMGIVFILVSLSIYISKSNNVAANISWIVAGLPDGRKVNVINSFYVKFERHGWTVEAVYIGNPMRHDEKYLLINQAFAGKQRLMPFINRQNFQRPNCDRFLASLLIPLYGRILDDNFAKKLKIDWQ